MTQSCPTLCDPMDCNTPGFPIHHQLPEPTQLMSIESVMPSDHLILSSPAPPAFYLSSYRVVSHESVLCIRWPKYWSFRFNISPSNEYSRLISFGIDWSDLLFSPRDSQESSPTPQFKRELERITRESIST